MKNLILICSITANISFLSCCTGQPDTSNSTKITGLIVKREFPDFDTANKQWLVIGYKSLFTRLYHYGNWKMVQVNRYIQKINLLDSAPPPPRQSVYYSFIYTDSSKAGILYDSCDISTAKVVDKDSMLGNEWVFKVDHTSVFDECEYKLINKQTDANGNLIEKYYLKSKKDTNVSGSIELVFSKSSMKGFDFSMGRRLEKEREMKLIKAVKYINPFYSGGFYVGEMRMPYELEEIDIKNKNELVALFEDAKKKIK